MGSIPKRNLVPGIWMASSKMCARISACISFLGRAPSLIVPQSLADVLCQKGRSCWGLHILTREYTRHGRVNTSGKCRTAQETPHRIKKRTASSPSAATQGPKVPEITHAGTAHRSARQNVYALPHCAGRILPSTAWHADHVLSHSDGGTHSIDNYLAAHSPT
jgi:hypothetical protein